MNDKSNGCNCRECKPQKIKDKLIYLIPIFIGAIGIITLSPMTVICSMFISHLINQNTKLKEKLKNSECWY
jgi:hypothetical protein